jgi:hypothetical protein
LVDGEETPPDNGDIALNGFERPCELSGPKRFAKDGARVELPRPSKRFGPDSSHGRSNPFNAISPTTI